MNIELLKTRMNQLKARPGADETTIDAITGWLETAEPARRAKINPYHLARDQDRRVSDVLTELLHGVKQGVFDLHWNIHCPHCNMITSQYDNLLQMKSEDECKMCSANFSVDFVERVEVTFSPTKEIDDTELPPFCLPPPSLNARYNFSASRGTSAQGVENLESGRYRYYCPITQARGTLRVEGDATTETQVLDINQMEGDEFNIAEASVRPGPLQINYRNDGHPVAGLFVHEDGLTRELTPAELPQFVSGMQLYHVPAFQNIFGDQVLSERERLKIAGVSILFTDIVSSTKLYETLGDAPAYNTVRDHFDILFQAITDEGGVVVKTIGDAVMASFKKAPGAIRAFAAAVARFEQYNEELKEAERIALKGGVHNGAAIMVSLNGHLDYFGSNINRAARIVDEAQRNQIVFSQSVLEIPETKETLRSLNIHSIKKKDVHLKGIGDETVYIADAKA